MKREMEKEEADEMKLEEKKRAKEKRLNKHWSVKSGTMNSEQLRS